MTIKSINRNFILCILVILQVIISTNGKEVDKGVQLSEPKSENNERVDRSLDANEDDRIGPFRNMFAGIETNYKSTYLGNRTAPEYLKDSRLKNDDSAELASNAEKQGKKSKKSKKNRKRKKKRAHNREFPTTEQAVLNYDIGPNVNVSLDMEREVVSVNIDQDYVKEILTGNWLTESDDGRKKKDKEGLMMKMLPLFILPFLIQSSIIPFLVAKLKLLLLKSIVVGKLAIFLLVISAIKNSQKIATFETFPTYFAPEHPSRRSEVFTGYRVEGRPTALVN